MSDAVQMPLKKKYLSFWTKLVYGTGDWGVAGYGTLRQVFYAIFLTDVVGLEPRLASVAALVGIVWDAINDPLVGMLSDRVRTRWGRRRPFLLWFSIPYGLSFLLLWYAPPFDSQIAKAIFITLAFMVADTLETLVAVPFSALTPELTPDYDERTSLTGFRMFFNLAISLVTAVAAPAIVDGVVAGGGTQQQGYLVTAAIFGGMAAIPFLLIFAVVREHELTPEQTNSVPFLETVRTAWANIPFRFATAVYMLNWITFDLVALVLPFYLLYWISSGNLLAQASVFGMNLPIEFGGLCAPADHVRAGLAVLDLHFQSLQQTDGLHCWDGLLGGRPTRDLLDPARTSGAGPDHERFRGHQRFICPPAPRRALPRCDRMGRTPHPPPLRGDLLRREEFHPQTDGCAGDLHRPADPRLVRLPDPARRRDPVHAT